MHEDVMLTPLIKIQRQKTPQTIEIPQRWLNTWIRHLCGDQKYTMANGRCCREYWQDGKKKKSQKGNSAYVFCETSLTGLLSHPWRLSRLRSHCRTGLGYTQPGRAPFIKPLLKVLLCASSGRVKSSVWHQNPEEFQGKFSWPQSLLVLGISVQTSSLLGVPPSGA